MQQLKTPSITLTRQTFYKYFILSSVQKEETEILLLAGEMSLERGVPFVHAIDLMLVVTLTRAL